jgi:hypothetical protein
MDRYVPTMGMDRIVPFTTARPVPESRSSGRSYPVSPANMARTNSTNPNTQLSSRGLRKAPVKNTRIMWESTAATKTSAAQ